MAINRFARVLMLSSFWLSLGGTMAYAQTMINKPVTLSVKKAKLGKILRSIRDKSSIRIVFSEQVVDRVAVQTVEAKNEKLTDLLNRILKGTGLYYVIQNDVVIIKEASKADIPNTSAIAISISAVLNNFVNGKVVLADNQPKALVTVINSTTGIQTLSDQHGNFSIPANKGDQIQFSHVGFAPLKVTIRNLKDLQIVLNPQDSTLDEVVLTGYQTIDKKLSTGSIFSLKGKDVAEPNVPNIASMLQGKVPGLSVETLSGSPNSVPRLRMRGTSTLIGNANPIWVVDGIVRENSSDINPDNPLGIDPSFLDSWVRSGTSVANTDLMGNSVAGINVNDIESIGFLKDAAATALYGTRAANGVIVITTKKGKAGPNVLSYSTSLGFVQKPSYGNMKLMNSKERIQLSAELIKQGLLLQGAPLDVGYEAAYLDLVNRRITQSEFEARVNQMETENTDWFDLLFQNSFNQSHSLSLSGGSEKSSFYSSLNYSNNKGSARKDALSSISGSIGMNTKLGNKWQIDFKLDGSYNKGTGYNLKLNNPMTYALTTSRTIPSTQFYESKRPMFGTDPNETSYPLHFNIFNEIDQTGNTTVNSQFSGALNISYQILNDLKFTSTFGGTLSTINNEQYSTERSFDVATVRGYDYGTVVPGSMDELNSPLPFGGIFDQNYTNLYKYSWRNVLNYRKLLFNGRDQLTFLIGQEINSSKRLGNSQFQYGYLKDRGESFAKKDNYYFWMIQNRVNKIDNLFSGFADVSYAFDQRYIIDANLRYDASNRFGQYTNSRFLPMWSISGRWNISDEPWLRDNQVLSDLSVKGSYGYQGNAVQDVGPDLILKNKESGLAGALNPRTNEYQLTMRSLAYPDLRWEKTGVSNLGINIGLFQSFVNLTTEFYYRKTKDALTRLSLPLEYGIQEMIINGGTLINKGLEVNINFNFLRKQNWEWSLSANSSFNKNKLNQGSDVVNYTFRQYAAGSAQVPGQPLGTFYVFDFKGLNPQNGMPLFKEIDDVEDPHLLGMDQYFIKAGVNHYPFTGGLASKLRYRNFSLSTQFSFGFGAHKLRNALFNGTSSQTVPKPDQNMPRWMIDRWKQPGDELKTDIPGFVDGNIIQTADFGSNIESRYWMYDHSTAQLAKADYVKCRSIQIGYRIPESFIRQMHLMSANVSFSMTNVFRVVSKDWKGQDPELPGSGTSALPQVPTYNLGLNVSF
ncbi:SusC/RagA family TonB-linked outer membrane protein [Sphingobacterium sp.]|uniref:SusC/RagA family TonB-linked outer membrane protein n=1 Tax=Sphingobacterium sp. TaxID=341027 RepID=UPI0031DEFDEF